MLHNLAFKRQSQEAALLEYYKDLRAMGGSDGLCDETMTAIVIAGDLHGKDDAACLPKGRVCVRSGQ